MKREFEETQLHRGYSHPRPPRPLPPLKGVEPMNSAVVHTAYCGANDATAIFGTTPSIRPSNAQLDALQVLQNWCERETTEYTTLCIAVQARPDQWPHNSGARPEDEILYLSLKLLNLIYEYMCSKELRNCRRQPLAPRHSIDAPLPRLILQYNLPFTNDRQSPPYTQVYIFTKAVTYC